MFEGLVIPNVVYEFIIWLVAFGIFGALWLFLEFVIADKKRYQNNFEETE